MELINVNNISLKNGELINNYLVNKNATLLLKDIQNNSTINITLNDNAFLKLSIIADSSFENVKISVNLRKNAQIEVYFADFSVGNVSLDATINLGEKGSSAIWHLASLSTANDNKKISVSTNHNAMETSAKVDNYGVCKDDSKLLFSGTSHIINGAIKSKTSQNAKIMVFDRLSNAIAKPILKIDENDVEASHAAAVGKISDEHLFYLTSRGISIEEARTLITLGYLKPIFKGFDEKEIDYLNTIIGGKF